MCTFQSFNESGFLAVVIRKHCMYYITQCFKLLGSDLERGNPVDLMADSSPSVPKMNVKKEKDKTVSEFTTCSDVLLTLRLVVSFDYQFLVSHEHYRPLSLPEG